MKIGKKVRFVWCILLAACSGGAGGAGGPLIGPDATMDEGFDAAFALGERIGAVFADEGFTQFDDLPATDVVNYRGIIEGAPSGGDGPAIAYYADLTLAVDFGTDTLTGTAENFVTDLPGFENPSGSAAVSGSVFPALTDAEFDLAATGSLVGDTHSADYDAVSLFGWFIGTEPTMMFGGQETDFAWTAGPNTGQVSWSDGDFGAERN